MAPEVFAGIVHDWSRERFSCDLVKRIMRILVCVKQITDPDSIRFEAQSGDNAAVVFGGEKRMNRYDAVALESALQIKDEFREAKVHALTLGPENHKGILIRALGMGADKGVLMKTGDYRDPDEASPAADFIAAYVKEHPFDLILTGDMSEDRMRSETGPRLAALTGLPFVGSVVELKVDAKSGVIGAVREIEGGVRESFELKMPAVIAAQTSTREPRYPALSKLLKAKKHGVRIVEAVDIGGEKARGRTSVFTKPLRQRKTVIIEGDVKTKARRLMEILRQRGVLQ